MRYLRRKAGWGSTSISTSRMRSRTCTAWWRPSSRLGAIGPPDWPPPSRCGQEFPPPHKRTQYFGGISCPQLPPTPGGGDAAEVARRESSGPWRAHSAHSNSFVISNGLAHSSARKGTVLPAAGEGSRTLLQEVLHRRDHPHDLLELTPLVDAGGLIPRQYHEYALIRVPNIPQRGT